MNQLLDFLHACLRLELAFKDEIRFGEQYLDHSQHLIKDVRLDYHSWLTDLLVDGAVGLQQAVD